MSTARFIVVITSPPFLALRSYLPADHPDKALELARQRVGMFLVEG